MVTEQLTSSQRSALLEQIPVGRFCEPEEFAHVVRFLVSPMSGFITGEIVDPERGTPHGLTANSATTTRRTLTVAVERQSVVDQEGRINMGKRPVAIVTGGNGGYGAGTAEVFRKDGIEVYITGRDEQKLDRVSLTLGVHAISADVQRAADWIECSRR